MNASQHSEDRSEDAILRELSQWLTGLGIRWDGHLSVRIQIEELLRKAPSW
jgi:hypothetical protein